MLVSAIVFFGLVLANFIFAQFYSPQDNKLGHSIKAGVLVLSLAVYVGLAAFQVLTPLRKPNIFPNIENVDSGTLVTIESPIPYADIYYTTDGSNPYRNGIPYEGNIKINNDCSITAYAKLLCFYSELSDHYFYITQLDGSTDALGEREDIPEDNTSSPEISHFIDESAPQPSAPAASSTPSHNNQPVRLIAPIPTFQEILDSTASLDTDKNVPEDISQTTSDAILESAFTTTYDGILSEHITEPFYYDDWSYAPIDGGYYQPDICLSRSELHLLVGETQRIYLCVDGDTQSFWAESYYVQCGYVQPVTVDAYGWVTGNEPGQCDIFWIINGTQYVCSVYVENRMDVVIMGPCDVEVGTTYSVNAYDKVSGNYINVDWVTDRPDCIELYQDGTFYAFNIGTVNIYAYDSWFNELLASCTFYVNPQYFEPEPEEVVYNGPFILPEDEPVCVPFEVNCEFEFSYDY